MGSRRTRHSRTRVACRRPWLTVALLAGFVAGPASALPREPDPPTRLILDPGLHARLRILAAGLQNEIVLCLTGVVDGGAAIATGFVMPDPYLSRTDGASFGSCPGTPVAIWHNHPLGQRRLERAGTHEPSYGRPRDDPGASPRDFCALSEADIQTAAREPHPFTVVAVDGDTWCWWTHDQVLALAKRRALRGDPVSGQLESVGMSPGSRSPAYRAP